MLNKERKQVKKLAAVESENIFKKLNKNLAMKDGSFPKADDLTPRAYNKEARRMDKQVIGTRLKQYDDFQKLKKSRFKRVKTLAKSY